MAAPVVPAVVATLGFCNLFFPSILTITGLSVIGGVLGGGIYGLVKNTKRDLHGAGLIDMIVLPNGGNITSADLRLLNSMQVAHSANGQSILTTEGVSADLNLTLTESSVGRLRSGNMSVTMQREHSDPVMGRGTFIIVDPTPSNADATDNDTITAFGTMFDWLSARDETMSDSDVANLLDALIKAQSDEEAFAIVASLAQEP